MDQIKAMPESKELTSEELDQICGGGFGDNGCYFIPIGDMEYRNGANRKKCDYSYTCSVPNDKCNCWGTDNCVDRWHKC